MVNSIFSSSVTYNTTNKNTNKEDNKDIEKTLNTEENKQSSKASKTKSTDNGVSVKLSDREKRKEIDAIVRQANQQTANFEKLVSSIFSKQSNKATMASMAYDGNLKNFYKNLTVDAKTIEKAKQDISEDGYYGVNQTSERILSFAKAIAGDDPKKIEEMRNAVDKGFKQVERMWGDELPEISQKTYDKVMETFDKWQNKE
ncbi:hypothetical protein [[Clostridium] colinum]|uniref:hypothetical protein n=1 Tax=[Clostridium] colinum TaxID=36835 RepID=UPI0020252D17|nr:hypothetical protein [[Clostridium] colinum]